MTWPVAVLLLLWPVAGAAVRHIDAWTEAVKVETEDRRRIKIVEVDPSISDAP